MIPLIKYFCMNGYTTKIGTVTTMVIVILIVKGLIAEPDIAPAPPVLA